MFLDFLFGGELLAWSFLLGFLSGVAMVVSQVEILGWNGAEKQRPAKKPHNNTQQMSCLLWYC